MNQSDKDFFHFLRNMTESHFDEWMATEATDIDIARAQRVLSQAKQETLNSLNAIDAEIFDLTEANNLLKRFTLQGA